MADILNGMFHHSSANVFGGHDYYSADGHSMGHTTDNVFGGENVYDSHGHQAGHTTDNVFGGEDVYDSHGHRVAYTMPEPGGGEAVHDAQGHRLGSFHESHSAVSFNSTGGDVATFRENLMGGYTADPLNNMARIQFPSMTW